MENYRKIFLIRHAKSDWSSDLLDDIDRPLAQRGIKAAHELSKFLRKKKYYFDLALISISERTKQTYKILTEEEQIASNTKYLNELYDAHKNMYLKLVSELPSEIHSVLFIGHNSGIEDFASFLLGSNELSFFTKFPTCSFFAAQSSAESWGESLHGRFTLSQFWTASKKDTD